VPVAFLAALVAATLVTPTVARAEVPPKAEPTLFVVRAPMSHDDGVLTVRSKKLQWFTDRPNRDTGKLTADELVDHWGGWGFAADPPNAALESDGVDIVGELSKPRIRNGRLRFDFEPLDGHLQDGNLGKVALFIDPTSPSQLTLQVVNNSPNPQTFIVFQQALELPGVLPLVWFSRYGYPQTAITFDWDQSYQVSVAQTGALVPGVVFNATQTIPIDPSSAQANTATLTYQPSGFAFLPPTGTSGLPPGTVRVVEDATIPENSGSFAYGQSGAPVFAAQAMPNFTSQYTTGSQQYWVAAGDFTQGQVLDPNAVTLAVAVPFDPGTTSMTATLNADNTWTVAPSGG
jgi:rhizosphere induced protein